MFTFNCLMKLLYLFSFFFRFLKKKNSVFFIVILRYFHSLFKSINMPLFDLSKAIVLINACGKRSKTDCELKYQWKWNHTKWVSFFSFTKKKKLWLITYCVFLFTKMKKNGYELFCFCGSFLRMGSLKLSVQLWLRVCAVHRHNTSAA